MYLDTDVILALLKTEDWLQSEVEPGNLIEPKTSVITVVEVQLVMFDAWSRDRLVATQQNVVEQGIELLPLSPDVLQAGMQLLSSYDRLNVFDSIHLGHAITLSEPIVSTDTLYPDVEEVEDVDPRELPLD